MRTTGARRRAPRLTAPALLKMAEVTCPVSSIQGNGIMLTLQPSDRPERSTAPPSTADWPTRRARQAK